MTIADNISAMTNFSSTEINKAITVSFSLINARLDEDYAEGDNKRIDNAVTELAVNILRNKAQDKKNAVNEEPRYSNIWTESVLELIDDQSTFEITDVLFVDGDSYN